MHRSTARLAALFLTVLATGGCTNEASDGSPAAAETTAPAGPAWLATHWYSSYDAGSDLIAEDISLEQDGTGRRRHSKISSYVPYGAADTTSSTPIEWSSDGITLWINSVAHPIVASPNCRLLLIGSHTFTGGNSPGCPFEMPALTRTEAAIVGYWSFQRLPSSGVAGTFGLLRIEADRHARFIYSPPERWPETSEDVEADVYFRVDSRGILHGRNAEGEEVLRLAVERNDTNLDVCTEDACFKMSPKAD